MAVNRDRPDRWKADVAQSVDMFNEWFTEFVPEAFRETRVRTSQEVVSTLKATDNLRNIRPEVLKRNPGILPTLRMSTCPPLARDRLVGLAGVSKSMVERMEKRRQLPVRLRGDRLDRDLRKIGAIIEKMADRDIFTWLDADRSLTDQDVQRAATIIADRLCGAVSNPIIRNAQETRQLTLITERLEARGYRRLPEKETRPYDQMLPGTFGFHINVPGQLEEDGDETVNIPVDVVIMRKISRPGDLPLLVEAKSAGDYTNVNKRRKEEAQKMAQLRRAHRDGIEYVLFLCGYFDTGYLGYEAAEGIDWVWEHRIDDLAEFGV